MLSEGVVTKYGEGGYKIVWGGQVMFYPYNIKEGSQKALAMLKGGGEQHVLR